MKIFTTTPVTAGNLRSNRKTSSASGTAFADMLSSAEEAGESEAAAPMTGTGSLSSVLAVQEVDDRESGRKKASRQASSTLDALEELRHALLLGEVPMHLLERIGDRLAQQRLTVTDGALLEIIKEIEVRAAVELAKLERAQKMASLNPV